MAEKETVMVLKVDLQCACCYKEVKKIICKFPQIRNQKYDEKGNTVTISVICCSPEKIRDKLCRKGRKVIKSIEIKGSSKPKEVDHQKPKDAEKPKVVVIENPKEPKKPKESEKPKVAVIEKPKEPEKAKPVVVEKSKDPKKSKEASESPPSKISESAPNLSKMIEPIPVNGFPSVFMVQPQYESYYHGYGVPPPPPPSHPFYDGDYMNCNGHGSSFHGAKYESYGNYFSEENPQGCSIM